MPLAVTENVTVSPACMARLAGAVMMVGAVTEGGGVVGGGVEGGGLLFVPPPQPVIITAKIKVHTTAKARKRITGKSPSEEVA